MNKKTIKPIVLSALSALAFGAVGTAGTFALFTDKAETTVNVTAGIVDVDSSIEILSMSELGNVPVVPVNGVYTNSIGGKSSVLQDTNGKGIGLKLEKWAPGDKLVARITNVNKSNVSINTRFLESHTSTTAKDLYNALTLTYDAKDGLGAGANSINHKFTDWTIQEPATDLVNGTPISYIDVTIEFPNADNEITAREEGANNLYQGADCTIVFTQQAVQANASVMSILQQMNAALAGEDHDTMHDALDEVKDIISTAQVASAGYVWSPVLDQFAYGQDITSNQYEYFKVYNAMPAEQTYSIYAYGWNNVGTVSLTGVGFDAGNSTGITSVSYEGAANARSNLIRTNSALTSVTVDAPNDTVHHYGIAQSVLINGIAGNSYHEFGTVPFIEIAKGRVALESTAEVTKMHFAYDAEEKKFQDIVVAYDQAVELPAFSRDTVALEDIQEAPKLVVELQNSTVKEEADSDYVWLYQQGLKEQIRVTDEIPTEDVAETVAQAPKSTDSTVAQKTSVAAEQIANNIAGDKTYDELVEEGNVEEDGSVKTAVVETVVVESGLNEQEKASAKAEAMEESIGDVISEIVAEESADYVARIGLQGYETIEEAFQDLNLSAGVSKELVLLQNAEYAGTYTVSAGKLALNLNSKTLSLTDTATQSIMIVSANAELVVKNGELSATAGGTVMVMNNGSIELDECSIVTNRTFGFYNSPTSANVSFSAKNSTIESSGRYGVLGAKNSNNPNLRIAVDLDHTDFNMSAAGNSQARAIEANVMDLTMDHCDILLSNTTSSQSYGMYVAADSNATITSSSFTANNKGYGFQNRGHVIISDSSIHSVSCNGIANTSGGIIDATNLSIVTNGTTALTTSGSASAVTLRGNTSIESTNSKYSTTLSCASGALAIYGGTYIACEKGLLTAGGNIDLYGGEYTVDLVPTKTLHVHDTTVQNDAGNWVVMEDEAYWFAEIIHADQDPTDHIYGAITASNVQQIAPLVEEGDTVNLKKGAYSTSDFDIFNLPEGVTINGSADDKTTITIDKFDSSLKNTDHADRLIKRSITFNHLNLEGSFAIEVEDPNSRVEILNCHHNGRDDEFNHYAPSGYNYGIAVVGNNVADVVIDNCSMTKYDNRSFEIDCLSDECNVTIKHCGRITSALYQWHVDNGSGVNLKFEECEISGWNAFASCKSFLVKDCTLNFSDKDTDDYFRTYGDVTFENCAINSPDKRFDVCAGNSTTIADVVFINCTRNGEALDQSSLFGWFNPKEGGSYPSLASMAASSYTIKANANDAGYKVLVHAENGELIYDGIQQIA